MIQPVTERAATDAIDQNPPQWRYWEQRSFSQRDKDSTTLLFGGLTFKHERLLRGALRSMGYHAEIIPTPTVEDFQTGKEYGNYGQCNPTYFTVGNLVNHLRRIEARGESRDEIIDKYLFLTATSPCGPCRFGMYQNEYRLATDNAGFNGFRVLTFGQSPKIDGKEDVHSRYFSVNEDFAAGIYFGMLVGDLINEMAYAVRPYETTPGETDRVVERSLVHLEEVIASGNEKQRREAQSLLESAR
jgi:predicted nucleotide-binding protein (sugar kinase/HSP70/actin superfamily)